MPRRWPAIVAVHLLALVAPVALHAGKPDSPPVDAVAPSAAEPARAAEAAAAQWRAGKVRFEGEWRSLDEVADIVANDRRWKDYERLKASLAGTAADHEEVARWCLKNGLENEERFHWGYVLLADPQHEIARDRLGVREYKGGLYTDEQIAEHESEAAAARAAFEKWKPVYSGLVRRLRDASGSERDAAFDELAATLTLESLPALDDAMRRYGSELGDEVVERLNLAIVGSLADDPRHGATLALLDYSVFANHAAVRRAAAQGLKPRPVTDYVPQLMAALRAPIQAEIYSISSPHGTHTYAERYYQAGPLADVKAAREKEVVVAQRGGARAPDGGPGPNTVRQRLAVRHANALRAQIARHNVAVANLKAGARNDRIREALRTVFAKDLGPDPRTYWQEWTSYNELYVEDHPTISLADLYETQYMPTMSCFAPGTPIWTQAGLKPIEQITIGEMVAAQDPDTGELAFRPVIGTTIRPASPMVRLDAGDDMIDSTLGHRFWVNGRGWEMAKFLAQGDALHSLAGTLELASTEQLPPAELTDAYNLVVDDFHTYFVGRSRLLVHDNSCPRPTTVRTLGELPASASTAAPAAAVR
jgi:hypothetical protein